MDNLFALFRKLETEKSAVGSVGFLVVGLGNPGDHYRLTRHNAGFIAVSHIAEKVGATVGKSKFKALIGEATLGSHRVLLMQPQTFMNHSGEAVRAAMDFYKLTPEQVLVIYDDISLACGKLRIRANGSAGGHNGIKSIIEHCGSSSFPRIKIGVGEKPHPEMDLADWVLSRFTESEQKLLADKMESIYNAAALIADGKIAEAMNRYNG